LEWNKIGKRLKEWSRKPGFGPNADTLGGQNWLTIHKPAVPIKMETEESFLVGRKAGPL